MPAGASLHAGLLHPTRDRERAQALAAVAALRREPRAALLERARAPSTASRSCAPASAGRTGRPARRTAGAGAACRACLRSIRSSPTLRRRCRRRRRGAGRSRAARPPAGRRCSAAISRCEHRAAAVVLVAQIDVDLRRCRPPRRRSACLPGSGAGRARGSTRSLKVPGSPSSMLTAISRGPGSARDDAPLAPGRKAGAAEAAQARVLQRLDDRLDVALAARRSPAAARSRPRRGSGVGR